MGFRVKDIERGAMRVLLNVGKLKMARALSSNLRVGVRSEQTYDRGQTITEIATIQEFGTGTIPPRPFIRGWFDSKSAAQLQAPFLTLGKQVLQGKIEPEEAYERIGEKFVGEVRKFIDKHVPPPLEDATVAKKRRTGAADPETPLKDTQALYEHIEWWRKE